MKISVVGTGYVGLVVGTCLADTGHRVSCVDIDAARVAALTKGEIPFYEPGLEELVVRNVEEERLQFTTSLEEAVGDCLVVFMCVGTPPGEDGQADMTAVYGVAEEIGKAITGYRIIISKSTCPVGTCDKIRELVKKHTDHPFDVVSNPEFLKEGAAVDDFMRPDRVVIGTDDVRVEEIMRELYAPFVRTGKPILGMSIRSAEMCKYAMNTMLASRLSMMNQLANIAAALGADIGEVREGLMADSRIGASYLFPGLGYGGSCLPKDVQAIAHLGRQMGVDCSLIEEVHEVNRRQRHAFVMTILDHFGGDLAGKHIGIWGAAFKPKTDDLREAPALEVIDGLLEAGAEVRVYDPVASVGVAQIYGTRVTVAKKPYDALAGAHALVVCTEWNEFRRPDYQHMVEIMADRLIFDGRNIYSPKTMRREGFRYYSIGRPPVEV